MTSLRDQVMKIGRLNHDLIPQLGFLIDRTPPLPRRDILELHLAFRSGNGWGLERSFNAWAVKQPWRALMPLSFFEWLSLNRLSKPCPHKIGLPRL